LNPKLFPHLTTRHPMLPSGGCDRATPHDYAGSRVEPDPDLGMLAPQVAHWFRCTETGAERRWGVEPLPVGAATGGAA
jgi:hypothetical protein